jgi:hypothetical protein
VEAQAVTLLLLLFLVVVVVVVVLWLSRAFSSWHFS